MSAKIAASLLGVFVVATGVLLRAWDLGSRPLWVDEAESSINALTILQHGYPVDHYLDMPLYENTLVQPWPESNEYEFKDLSYSDRGMAVYHGWLPLYAIAASFRVAGVEPDEPDDTLRVRHAPDDLVWRTVAARAPSIVFAAAMMILLFAAGQALYGRDAAWAALVGGAYLDSLVWLSRQARYYSATLALTTAAGLMVWRIVHRGAWRDVLIGATVFVLLFHTHALSFVILAVVLSCMSPLLFKHRQAFHKLGLFAVIVGAGTIPWALWTGIFEQSRLMPRAWPLLSLPGDLLPYATTHKAYVALYGAGLVWWAAVALLRGRLPGRIGTDLFAYRRTFIFLCIWISTALSAFLLLIPAASFFISRMSLVLLPPGLLLAAVLLASMTRAWSRTRSPAAAPVILFLVLFGSGRIGHLGGVPQDETQEYDPQPIVRQLRSLDLRAGTRLYATPNDHLPLTFYTGLPVQSIAPVRKRFLDSYDGDLVIIESIYRTIEGSDPLSWRGLQRAAIAAGQSLPEADARLWAARLSNRLVREEVAPRVARVHPPLEDLPPFAAHELRAQRRLVDSRLHADAQVQMETPILRGFDIVKPEDWWQIFFYRFVDPETRRGPGLNYRDRLRHADAHAILDSPWVLYHSPAPGLAVHATPGATNTEAPPCSPG